MCLPITYRLCRFTDVMVLRSKRFTSHHQTTLSSHSSRPHWTRKETSSHAMTLHLMINQFNLTSTLLTITKVIIQNPPIILMKLTNFLKLKIKLVKVNPLLNFSNLQSLPQSQVMKRQRRFNRRPTKQLMQRAKRRKPNPQSSSKRRTWRKQMPMSHLSNLRKSAPQ